MHEGSWWYCKDCGSVFMYEDIRFEKVENRHWWLDDCPVETWCDRLCPECGSMDIDECEYCEYCGDPFKPGELIDYICERCRKEEENMLVQSAKHDVQELANKANQIVESISNGENVTISITVSNGYTKYTCYKKVGPDKFETIFEGCNIDPGKIRI